MRPRETKDDPESFKQTDTGQRCYKKRNYWQQKENVKSQIPDSSLQARQKSRSGQLGPVQYCWAVTERVRGVGATFFHLMWGKVLKTLKSPCRHNSNIKLKGKLQ